MNGALIRRVDSRKPFIVMSMPALSSQSRMFVVTARAYTQPSRVPVMLAAASVALVGMISFSLPSLSTEKNNTANGKKRGDINSLIAQNKHNNSVQIKRTRNNCSSNNSKFEHHPRTAKEEGIFFAASMMQDKASKASPTSSPPQTVSSTATLADNPAQQTKLSVQRRRTTERMKSTKTRKSVYTIYDIEPAPLGEGSFGQVFAATNKQSGERLALKKIRKEFTDELEFQKEMNALLHIRACGGHPNICMLREHFEEDDNFILILDLIRGGDLFDHLIDHGAYSEADAARLTREVACALSFLHGIGVVHADLKPENLMLSSKNGLDAVIQVVDFGSAEVLPDEWGDGPPLDGGDGTGEEIVQRILLAPTRKSSGTTPAYCPPEAFRENDGNVVIIRPSWDMWSLGIILYIMLTGVHPFDCNGDLTDAELVDAIKTIKRPPLEGSALTAHLSPSAIDLLAKLMSIDPTHRLSAHEMLEHPWVLGKTAKQDIIAGSDQRLSRFRRFRSRIAAKVFRDLVNWSDGGRDDERDYEQEHPPDRGKSLMEKAFTNLDKEKKGFITLKDVAAAGLVDEDDETYSTASESSIKAADGNKEDETQSSLSLSGFSELVGENLQSKFFPRGHVVFHEGELGDYMYFINSGTVQVSTKDGFEAKLGQGDSFGVGSLIRPGARRSATIRCITPLHVIRIDKAYFNKYVASSESGKIAYKLREKVNKNNFGRAEFILWKQSNLQKIDFVKGGCIFERGDEADALYTVDEGEVDMQVAGGKTVYRLKSGDAFGVQSLLMDRPRKASAYCVSDHCRLRTMCAEDFHRLLHSSSELAQSFREMALRREFRRAVVLKTRRAFPSTNELKAVFDEVDTDGSGDIGLEDLRELLRHLDKTLSDDEIRELIRSMDLSSSGSVNFDEFQSIFGHS